jgi:hypothetical protein
VICIKDVFPADSGSSARLLMVSNGISFFYIVTSFALTDIIFYIMNLFQHFTPSNSPVIPLERYKVDESGFISFEMSFALSIILAFTTFSLMEFSLIFSHRSAIGSLGSCFASLRVR